MPYRRISEDTKRRMVAAYEADEDYVQTARSLKVSRQAAWQLVRRYLDDEYVVQPRGGAREQATRTHEEMADAAVEIVADYPAYTLEQLNDE